MDTSLQYFLVIAEEKSIVEAARKLYVSPQNLSNHMRRLEQEYGVLFIRKPQFQLTHTGKILYNTLNQIHILEQSMAEQIKDTKVSDYTLIRFGIHLANARALLPSILPELYRRIPNLYLQVLHVSVDNAEKLLEKGELDIFFGVDATANAAFDIIPLHQEPIYVVVSDTTLKNHDINIDDENVLTVEQLRRLPFLLSPPNSRLRQKIELYCKGNDIILREIMQVSDFELQVQLAAKDLGASFIPARLLKRVAEINSLITDDNHLHVMRAENLHFSTNISLVTHKLSNQSPAIETLIKVFREEFPDKYYHEFRDLL